MAVRGQRFQIDLGTDNEYEGDRSSRPVFTPSFNLGLVGDIKERVDTLDLSDDIPPSPPKFKSSQTGFPPHRIRTGPSKFKLRKDPQISNTGQPQGQPDSSTASSGLPQRSGRNMSTSITSEAQIGLAEPLKDSAIDEENKQRLAQMSDEEIDEARRELMTGLSPSLIEKLLRKANIDQGRTDSITGLQAAREEGQLASTPSTKKVTFEDSDPESTAFPTKQSPTLPSDPDAPPLHPPPDLQAASSQIPLPPPPKIYFPQPPKPPDLDPSDPDFLSALHSTYFPSLPANPSTLAWMAPIDSTAESESAYSPAQASLPPSSLRFDFRGHLLPPRLSSQIPSTKGLHHHANAPSSAGYTIPELAHLARSAYPAQRCIAYQTLGRILYRLGRGDFGREGEDLCEGLWGLMDQGRVVEGIVEAAGKGEKCGNRSLWVTATDAVWLWRKGGGRRWKGR